MNALVRDGIVSNPNNILKNCGLKQTTDESSCELCCHWRGMNSSNLTSFLPSALIWLGRMWNDLDSVEWSVLVFLVQLYHWA